MQAGMRADPMALSGLERMQELVGKNLNNIVGSLWQRQEEGSGSSHGNMSPRSGVSEHEPESPGDSGTDLRHDCHTEMRHKDVSDDQSDTEHDDQKMPTIGIRSDLLPMHPIPREGLKDMSSLHGLPALEALRRQAGGQNPFLAGMGQGSPISSSMPSFQPSNRPSQPPTPQSTGSNELGSSWTFEEQFKQLYEIDDNPKRREFLDELFAFMQKRGTPINRLPIMAKQVLDLYELFNLVVARGGLVEVINKKQWQEIIKGLGLPSSITSAAFTLRTQYTKYLYPWEIHTKGFSSQSDLQNAIDGNKREGRRIEPYGMQGMPQSSIPSQMSPMGMSHLPPTHSPQNHPLSPSSQHPSQDQMGALEMTRLALWKLYNQGQPGLPPLMPNLPMDLFANQEKALNLHVKQEQENEKLKEQKREEEREEQKRRDDQLKERLAALDQTREKERELKERLAELDRDHSSPPPAKRQCVEPPHNKPLPLPASNRTNISMASRQEEDGRTSMEVSMEINGIIYSGVLYARTS